MKKNVLISGIIGATFFGLSYLGLELNFIVSLIVGIIALVAGNLVFSKKETIDVQQLTDEEVIRKIKNLNNQTYGMINKVNSSNLKSYIKDIVESTTKIIEKVSKDKADLKKIRTFVEYYLPVTLKILRKYDEIENQGLNSKDSKVFMKTVEEKIKLISDSFRGQLAALYQDDLVDVDAELTVLENMLKSEGYSNLNDFDISEKRGNSNG
ncbi:MAG: 5-bromo-4-chloroindolyl phosphate hydrolysis family protein [Clostridia bacterium]|nr:5-bromo-4-chloroindolyl phosphate hydrolysis family protein [Clostridia bacterium]